MWSVEDGVGQRDVVVEERGILKLNDDCGSSCDDMD
jgi:hypothetical protein